MWRKTLLLAAVALAALAVSAPSASAWEPDGLYHVEGSLTTHLLTPSGSTELICDVEFKVELEEGAHNFGWVHDGEAANCTSSILTCAVVPDFHGEPYPLRGESHGDGTGPVHVGLVRYEWLYEGASCPISGLELGLEGGVIGDYDSEVGHITFPASEELDILVVHASNNQTLVPLGTRAEFEGEVNFEGEGPFPVLE